MTQTFSTKITEYFGQRLGWQRVRVLEARKIMGGISRETWQVSLETTTENSGLATREIILRLDPPVSLLESNRDLEYMMFRALHAESEIPVPEPICNEPDASYLGTSFMAVAALPGVAAIAAITQPPFAAVGREIARAHFTMLGAISRFDYHKAQLQQWLKAPTAQSAAFDMLMHWEGLLRKHSLGPAPITEAAIRHLKRNPPAPAQSVAVVHGDFRLGNCLYLPDGTLSGVLDWEMVHLGDPLEDLAWALHPDWRPRSAAHLVAGYITEEEAIQTWERASRLKADRSALHWWRLFTCVKAAGLWTTGGDKFLKGKVKGQEGELVYAFTAWGMSSEETRMLGYLGGKT